MALNSISALPEETLFGVFSYLGPKDLGRCRGVNKEWMAVASDSSLWRPIIERMKLKPFTLDEKPLKTFIKEINSYDGVVESYDELINKLKEYIDKLSSERRGCFICRFDIKNGIRITHSIGNQSNTDYVVTRFIGRLPDNFGHKRIPTNNFVTRDSNFSYLISESYPNGKGPSDGIIDIFNPIINKKIIQLEKLTPPKVKNNLSRQYFSYLAVSITVAACSYFAMMN
ncbi:MAG: hypothetical protein K1000chlam2_00404 [Chlamydiae bacterium]|nr:hypothetical protein [Chlamydiota bacterium]